MIAHCKCGCPRQDWSAAVEKDLVRGFSQEPLAVAGQEKLQPVLTNSIEPA
jgi:hypothetical protein